MKNRTPDLKKIEAFFNIFESQFQKAIEGIDTSSDEKIEESIRRLNEDNLKKKFASLAYLVYCSKEANEQYSSIKGDNHPNYISTIPDAAKFYSLLECEVEERIEMLGRFDYKTWKEENLTDDLCKIRLMSNGKVNSYVGVDLEDLAKKEEGLEDIKAELTDELALMKFRHEDLIELSKNYDKSQLDLVKHKISEASPKVKSLNEEFKQKTGYDSTGYLKYSHWANLSRKKIKEIETNLGGE